MAIAIAVAFALVSVRFDYANSIFSGVTYLVFSEYSTHLPES